MSCNACGCSPCKCSPCGDSSLLNQPRILNPTVSGGLFQNGLYQSPTITGGTASNQQIIGATIDCTTLGCTQPPGTNNATLATTAFVNTAIGAAISGANPAFCGAVQDCISSGGAGVVCLAVANCIALTPSIINNVGAFGPGAQATQAAFGVVRYATPTEFLNAACGVAIEPCTLIGALASAPGANAFWTAINTAVGNIITGLDFCALTAGCGYAPLVSPGLSGIPTAPTALPGTNTGQIATTAFVQQEVAAATASISAAYNAAISAAISAGNPSFCAAVVACGASSGRFASYRVQLDCFSDSVNVTVFNAFVISAVNCAAFVATFGAGAGSGPFVNVNVAFSSVQPNDSWKAVSETASTLSGANNWSYELRTGILAKTSAGGQVGCEDTSSVPAFIGNYTQFFDVSFF